MRHLYGTYLTHIVEDFINQNHREQKVTCRLLSHSLAASFDKRERDNFEKRIRRSIRNLLNEKSIAAVLAYNKANMPYYHYKPTKE